MTSRDSDIDDEESFHSADEGDSDDENSSQSDLAEPIPKSNVADLGEVPPVVPKLTTESTEISAEATEENVPPLSENTRNLPLPLEEKDAESGWDVDWDIDDEPLVTPDSGDLRPITDQLRDQTTLRSTDLPKPSVSRKADYPTDGELADDPERPSSLWTGGWTSILSGGINTLTEGLTSVLETVDAGLGAPTPEDLVRLSSDERAALQKKADELKEPWPPDDRDDCDSAEEILSEVGSEAGGPDETSSGYQSSGSRDDPSAAQLAAPPPPGFWSGVTSVFENTSKTLVSGSLEVLETLGKKTFDVLTETDGTTQRRRFILSPDKPNLSQVLRSLKQREEESSTPTAADQTDYATLFEQYQGMINLEALEMLSSTCRAHVQSVLSSMKTQQNTQLVHKLRLVEDIFEEVISESDSTVEDNDRDFDSLIMEELGKLDLAFSALKFFEVFRKHKSWVNRCIVEQDSGCAKSAQEVHGRGVECLSELTASSVELFLKLGQLLLVAPSAPAPQPLLQLNRIIVEEISVYSVKFSTCLNTVADDSSDPDAVNPYLTNLFLEANNSSSYVRDAFRLLGPVVQQAFLQHYTDH